MLCNHNGDQWAAASSVAILRRGRRSKVAGPRRIRTRNPGFGP